MSDSKSGSSDTKGGSGPPSLSTVLTQLYHGWNPLNPGMGRHGTLVVPTNNPVLVEQGILVSSGICTEMCFRVAQRILVDGETPKVATEAVNKEHHRLLPIAVASENRRLSATDELREFSLKVVQQGRADPRTAHGFRTDIETLQQDSALGCMGGPMITLLLVPQHTIMLIADYPNFYLLDPNLGLYQFRDEAGSFEAARGCYYALLLSMRVRVAGPCTAFTVTMGF